MSTPANELAQTWDVVVIGGGAAGEKTLWQVVPSYPTVGEV